MADPAQCGCQMDQYDNPMARYSLVLDDDGRVLAGSRAMSTAATWGDHTYMLKDAITGKLSSIPSNLLDEVIDSPKVWECTRLVISPEVKSMRARTQCLDLIVEGLIDVANAEGANTLISLSNLWLLCALERLGYGAELMGDPTTTMVTNMQSWRLQRVTRRRPDWRRPRKPPTLGVLGRPRWTF
jgi:N-acyl-L-homoserine lactone synthetase